MAAESIKQLHDFSQFVCFFRDLTGHGSYNGRDGAVKCRAGSELILLGGPQSDRIVLAFLAARVKACSKGLRQRMRHHRKRHRRAGVAGRRGPIGWLRRLFRERQVYLRSEGTVQFITLSPTVQVVSSVILLAGMFWLAFATVNILFKDQLLALEERRMYQARLDYEDRIAELRRKIDAINARLLINQKGYLAKVDGLRNEYKRLVERHRQISEFLSRRWGADKAGKTKDKSGSLEIPAQAAIAELLNRPPLRRVYTRTFATRAQAERPLRDLKREFAAFEDFQVALLDRSIIQARSEVATAARIFSRIGINPKAVIKQSSFTPRDAVGGPFVAVSTAKIGSKKLADRIESVVDELVAAEKLRLEAQRLPLTLPLAQVIRVTSNFGFRRDPFKRVASLHTGIDLKAPYGAPVRTQADGVVTYAGWQSGYGKLVAIRHDNGVSTRYAHLSKILVTKGERVSKGKIVGAVGNTGRSTGFHLHYETRVNGRAINPRRVWALRNAVQALSQ